MRRVSLLSLLLVVALNNAAKLTRHDNIGNGAQFLSINSIDDSIEVKLDAGSFFPGGKQSHGHQISNRLFNGNNFGSHSSSGNIILSDGRSLSSGDGSIHSGIGNILSDGGSFVGDSISVEDGIFSSVGSGFSSGGESFSSLDDVVSQATAVGSFSLGGGNSFSGNGG